jgi:hypothetical protein
MSSTSPDPYPNPRQQQPKPYLALHIVRSVHVRDIMQVCSEVVRAAVAVPILSQVQRR